MVFLIDTPKQKRGCYILFINQLLKNLNYYRAMDALMVLKQKTTLKILGLFLNIKFI